MRWQHPERGLIEPARVHPAGRGDGADRSRSAVRARARAATSWPTGAIHDPAVTVSVNLSARQLEDPRLVPIVRRRARGQRRRPRRAVPRRHRDGAWRTTPTLRRAALDGAQSARGQDRDRRLRDRLVVAGEPRAAADRRDQAARSLVAGLGARPGERRWCARSSSSATRSASSVVAEGVETEAQLDQLRDARLRRRSGVPVRPAARPAHEVQALLIAPATPCTDSPSRQARSTNPAPRTVRISGGSPSLRRSRVT